MSQTFHTSLRLLETSTPQNTSPEVLNTAYSALISISPLFLIILGVMTFLAGALAKFIGIVIILLGIILLVLPYLGFIHQF